MQHQIHSRDAQHCAVGVKARKHRALEMIPLFAGHCATVVDADVLRGRNKKARCAAGGVPYHQNLAADRISCF